MGETPAGAVEGTGCPLIGLTALPSGAISFFALVFDPSLCVTAPRKKMGASTCSSSGPAMKSCLISTRCALAQPVVRKPSARNVLPILKDRRQARGERHQLLRRRL